MYDLKDMKSCNGCPLHQKALCKTFHEDVLVVITASYQPFSLITCSISVVLVRVILILQNCLTNAEENPPGHSSGGVQQPVILKPNQCLKWKHTCCLPAREFSYKTA